MPLAFPPPTAARDDLDGLLLLGGQPTAHSFNPRQRQLRNQLLDGFTGQLTTAKYLAR